MVREAAIHPRREAPGAEDTDLSVHSQSLSLMTLQHSLPSREWPLASQTMAGGGGVRGMGEVGETLSKALPRSACDWTF